MTTQKNQFADRLRRVVERAGGVVEIARIAGVTTQSVYGWLAGSKPYRDRVTRICIALGINEAWLWRGDGPEVDDGETPSATREEPHSNGASHGLAGMDDIEIAERLSNMVRAFADVPPAFGHDALTAINATFAEFRRRAEVRVSRDHNPGSFKRK